MDAFQMWTDACNLKTCHKNSCIPLLGNHKLQYPCIKQSTKNVPNCSNAKKFMSTSCTDECFNIFGSICNASLFLGNLFHNYSHHGLSKPWRPPLETQWLELRQTCVLAIWKLAPCCVLIRKFDVASWCWDRRYAPLSGSKCQDGSLSSPAAALPQPICRYSRGGRDMRTLFWWWY